MAKVDFVVPCYGYGQFLPLCVNSILTQSLDDIRVLIINDASPDGTYEVAETLAKRDTRVTVLHNRRNIGLVGALNQGIAWAQADYLLALSADDMLAPGAAARAVSVLDSNTDIGMVYGRCLKFAVQPLPVNSDSERPASFTWSRYEGQQLIETFCATATNFIETPTVFVRTGLQKRIGGYLPQLPHCCDFEMWLRFAVHGAVAYIAAVQGYRRDHPSAMNKTYISDRWPDFEQRKLAFDILFANYGNQITNAEALQEDINKLLAEEGYWSAARLLFKWRWASAQRMMRFALRTRPSLKFRPPFKQALRLARQTLCSVP